MKNIISFLIIALILLLIVIIVFAPASETNPFIERYTEQINTVIKKSDTLNSTIDYLNTRNIQLKAKETILKKDLTKSIKEIESLPADDQIKAFKAATDCTGNISIKTSTSGDTLAQIPINSILKANLLFTELESINIQNLLLDSITANQDSIISTLQQIIINQKIRIDLLNQDYNQQNDVIKQKDIEMKKQKIKHRLELICAGVIIAFIIFF